MRTPVIGPSSTNGSPAKSHWPALTFAIATVWVLSGEVIRTEEYRYGPEGTLLERVVRKAGEPPETTAVDRAESDARSEDAP